MPKYLIEGKTLDGSPIKEYFEAVSEKRALLECLRTIGRLQDGYQISIIPENFRIPEYKKPEHTIHYDNEIDQEILRFYRRIKANVITQKGYDHFRENLIGPIVKRAVKDLWNELDNVATKEEIEQELVEDIINEFLPRYNREKGPLLKFLKLNIRNRVRKKWSREVYVNADNPNKKRPRKEVLKELEFMEYLKNRGSSNGLDAEKELEKIRALAAGFGESLPKHIKKGLFTFIQRAGLHRKLLKRKRQIEVFEQYYGKKPLNEREIAEMEGLTQQTINITKRRAENNILKQIL